MQTGELVVKVVPKSFIAIYLSFCDAGKCIFPVDSDTISDGNEFLELSSTETNFIASRSVMIGGSQKRVAKIMLYKMSWIQNNYLGPLQRKAGINFHMMTNAIIIVSYTM